MISENLQKKIDRSIRLLKQFTPPHYEGVVEIAYSGGKDSDVILQLAKESGLNYRAIYKNTSIDPPGTARHAKDMGAEIIMPKKTFFQLVELNGFPNRFMRHCCKYLKEYKVLDKSVMGVRKSESTKRNARYNEPTECRFYGSKKEHVEAIYPILEWTDEDVRDFLQDRNIQCAPVYYDEQGVFHVERRLGCMGCPLKTNNKRKADFKKYPRLVRAWIKAGQRFLELHPTSKTAQRYSDAYEWFFREIFFENQNSFDEYKTSLFGLPDYKAILEEQFNIDLTIKNN